MKGLVLVTERSAVRVVYVDAERHSIRHKRAADSDGSVSVRGFVHVCVCDTVFMAPRAPGIHLAVPHIILFDLLFVSQILTVLPSPCGGALQ